MESVLTIMVGTVGTIAVVLMIALIIQVYRESKHTNSH